jgi:putative oxidoreductase
LPKFENLQGTQGFFASIGLPVELALVIGLLEIIGGVVLILGLLTRVASILFIIEMIGIIFILKAGNSFTGEGGYELELLLLAISISLALSGPGRVSIERDVLKREIFPGISYKTKH